MKLTKVEEAFLNLLKGSVIGIRRYVQFPQLSAREWEELYALSECHGLMAVMMAELDKLPKDRWPDMDLDVEFVSIQFLHEEGYYT